MPFLGPRSFAYSRSKMAVKFKVEQFSGLFTHLTQDINGYIQSLLQKLVRPLLSTYEPATLCQFISWVSTCLSGIGKNIENEVTKQNSVAFVQGFIKIQSNKNYQLFAPEVILILFFQRFSATFQLFQTTFNDSQQLSTILKDFQLLSSGLEY